MARAELAAVIDLLRDDLKHMETLEALLRQTQLKLSESDAAARTAGNQSEDLQFKL